MIASCADAPVDDTYEIAIGSSSAYMSVPFAYRCFAMSYAMTPCARFSHGWRPSSTRYVLVASKSTIDAVEFALVTCPNVKGTRSMSTAKEEKLTPSLFETLNTLEMLETRTVASPAPVIERPRALAIMIRAPYSAPSRTYTPASSAIVQAEMPHAAMAALSVAVHERESLHEGGIVRWPDTPDATLAAARSSDV